MAEKTFDAAVDQLDEVLAFVTDQLDLLDCPPKHRIQIEVAVEELFVNIASYAYRPGTGTADVTVEAFDNPKAVEITFRDSGVPYDPLAKQDPDISLSADDRQIGGLGIFMVKKTMDEVSYRRENGENILTIRKKLS